MWSHFPWPSQGLYCSTPLRASFAADSSATLSQQRNGCTPFLFSLPVWSGLEDRGAIRRRGKSELSRAAGWLTARRGDATESATENRPPIVPASRAQARGPTRRQG